VSRSTYLSEALSPEAFIFEIFERIMGPIQYDTERFENSEQIDKDLFCPICTDVLQDAVYFGHSEHSVCCKCIIKCLQRKGECTVCRTMEITDIKPIVRFMKKSLN